MLSRRQFLATTAAAGTLAAGATLTSQQSSAQASKPAKRLIVDSQVHLWKAQSDDWKWVPGMVPQIPDPLTIERVVPIMDEAGVDRIVVVPPSWIGERNDYALEAVRRYPTRFAVMGRFPLQRPDLAPLLHKWKEQPGMLGVRQTFLGKSAAWVTDGSTDWFWAEAEKAGLPVMFLAPGQAKHFAVWAERHPKLTMIVDHMGLNLDTLAAGKLQEAIDGTASLAKYPNVSVKLVTPPGWSIEPYPFRDWQPHIKRLFDAYGPQRCYWGTDMTNRGIGLATYTQRITQFTEEMPFLSESDKDWIMGRGILQRLNWA
jgi:predicted TIM-barrel fold metal-dependent hydrolase